MIYLASPYSSTSSKLVKARAMITTSVTAELIRRGLPIFSPIVHCHDIALTYEMPTDAAHWEKYNTNFIRKCDYLLLLALPGWRKSLGVTQEIALAKQLGISIRYCDSAGSFISHAEALELD